LVQLLRQDRPKDSLGLYSQLPCLMFRMKRDSVGSRPISFYWNRYRYYQKNFHQYLASWSWCDSSNL